MQSKEMLFTLERRIERKLSLARRKVRRLHKLSESVHTKLHWFRRHRLLAVMDDPTEEHVKMLLLYFVEPPDIARIAESMWAKWTNAGRPENTDEQDDRDNNDPIFEDMPF